MNDILGSTTNLGAVGNAPNVPPLTMQPRDQCSGSQMYGVGSNLQGYYPEEFNCLNQSQPSQGIPSASQTLTTSYISDAGSDCYRTGSSVSRRSRLGNPAGNTPVGGRPLGLGFGPNILNPINPNQRPPGNLVPQGNMPQVPPPVEHNVVPPAQPQPLPQPMNMPDNNPVQPARQVLPPAYQDYGLHANPGQPAPVPPMQGNPPLYQPPYGPNPPGDPPGWGNPNWNMPWGYPQQRQYPNHQWDPHHQWDPKLSMMGVSHGMTIKSSWSIWLSNMGGMITRS